MAYIDPWDLTTPPELAPIDQGNDRIRELKRALDERLRTAFGDSWPADDPLHLYDAKIVRGHEQGDDEVPAIMPLGSIWQDPQTGIVYVGTGIGRMVVTAEAAGMFSADTEANKPNPPINQFFYATDSNTLYVKEGAAWVAVNGKKTFTDRYGFSNKGQESAGSSWGLASIGSEVITNLVAPPTVKGFSIRPIVPIGATLRYLRLNSHSIETGGADAKISVVLYKADRTTGAYDVAGYASVVNQDGDNVMKVKESADLNYVVTADDILVMWVYLETFASNNNVDAKFSYAELEYEF